VAHACNRIAIAVNKSSFGDILGTAHTENVQGKVQKKVDVIANDVPVAANVRDGHRDAPASADPGC
jgi:fructose-1,6-bisphosphatase I